MLILAAALMELAFCSAQGPAKDSKDPFDILLSSASFDDSAVGYAARRTPVYDAFSRLYKAGKASTDSAKRLVLDATPEGRVYGFLILRHVAPADAEALTRRMSQDQSPVTMASGCEVWKSSVREVVRNIQSGKHVIVLPE